jgi:acetyl esterase
MAVHPEVRSLLDAMGPALSWDEEVSPEELRAQTRTLLAAASGPPEEVGRVEERRLPGPAGELTARVYWPASPGPWPALAFFHGGGFVIGDLDTHDGTCRHLCNGADTVVVSVDYRLAPEHRFPAAAEDAYSATAWLGAHAGELGADPARLAVGGDSAGGNLAAVAALMARDRGGPALAFQLLVYPVCDFGFDTPSYRENAEGYFLTRQAMQWFWAQYLASPDDARSPYACPLRAEDLAGLPPALVVTAEHDPLRDEGEAYARRLADAGVPVTLRRYDGMIHGFFSMWPFLEEARRANAETFESLRAALSGAKR